MKMTKNVALTTALTYIPAEQTEVREIITSMIAQLSKPRKTSEEAKAKRKEKAAAARAELMAQVLPVLRGALTSEGMTAKALYETCADALPADFTVNRVQYVLLHEMADEVIKCEAKGKPNIYKAHIYKAKV